MLADRPSEPNPVELVLPRTAEELDEAAFVVSVDDGETTSPVNGELNCDGD